MQIAIALATCTPTPLSYVMARILTQTLLQQLFIRNCKQSPALILKSSPDTNTHTHSRLFFSSSSSCSIEIDHLGGAASSSDGEFEALALKRLDDLIHGIIVQKSTPDWLPFVPGSSFWVPPRPNFLDLVTNLSHHHHHHHPPHSLSFSTSRGWPCSSTFFLLNHHEEGSAQPNEDLESKESAETEMEVDIDVKASDDTSRSENEED